MNTEKKDNPVSEQDMSRSIGSLLSRQLAHTDKGPCLQAADIAAVVDGTVSAPDKDRMLKHISACDACYDMFIMTSELQEEPVEPVAIADVEEVEAIETEPRDKGRKRVYFKPLAMAATVLVAVFALYIYFRTDGIPKAPNSFYQESEQMEQTETAAPSPASTGKEVVADSYRVPKKKSASLKSAAKTAGKSSAPLREEGEEALTDGVDKSRQTGQTAKADQTDKKEGFIPIKGNKSKRKNESKSVAAVETGKPQVKSEEKQEFDVGVAGDTQRAQQDDSVGMPPRLQEKRQAEQETRGDQLALEPPKGKRKSINREAPAQTVLESSAPRRKSVAKKQRMLQSVQKGGPSVWNDVQRQQAVVGRYSSYIADSRLQSIFSETMRLSKQLQGEYDRQQAIGMQQKNRKATDSFLDKVSPTMTTGGGGGYVKPNIGWFLSKSAPGSTAYRFFTLARSGWCDEAGIRHGPTSPKANKELLTQWENLLPTLDGIFQRIAGQTIACLRSGR